MKKSLLPIALLLLASGTLLAQENTLTLSDGTVLRNPYLLGRTPAAVRIGSDSGEMTALISELPEEYQKALKYDPVKAADYTARQLRRQQKVNDARSRAKLIQKLKNRIRELKIYIESDEKLLPKLEQAIVSGRSEANQLAAVSPSSGSGHYSVSWGRWGVRRYRHRRSNHEARRAARARINQVNRMNRENEAAVNEYYALDRKIQRQKIELGEKEDLLAQLEEQNAQESAQK